MICSRTDVEEPKKQSKGADRFSGTVMLSAASERYLKKQERRRRIRLVGQVILVVILLVVAVWGFKAYQSDHHTFAWDRTVSVAVVALLDEDKSNDRFKEKKFIRRFLSESGPARRNLREVVAWMEEEFARHVGEKRTLFDVSSRGPLKLETPPPALPEPDASYWEGLQATRRFLGYFEDIKKRDELNLGQYDVTIFVYFYDFADENRRKVFSQFDSLASRRNRFGVVYAPVTQELLGYTCAVVAHELCHVLGATDKYDGGRSVYPDGYADPNRSPLYPQKKAEIMALGRPVSETVERPVRDLRECVVGAKPAVEMNWVGP